MVSTEVEQTVVSLSAAKMDEVRKRREYNFQYNTTQKSKRKVTNMGKHVVDRVA